MNKRAKTAILGMVGLLAGGPFSWGQPPRALLDSVRSGENRQAEIKGDTQRTADDLDAIVAEFERNGLAEAADVQVLKSIRGVLGSLTDKEMAKVIALLQAARSAPNASKATTNVSEAVQGQRTIIIQFQQLLLEFQRQQELTQLSIRFARLAEDQNKNMKAARSLAKVPRANYTEQQNAMLSLQQSEQAAIRDQVVAQLKKLADLGQDTQSVAAEKIAKVLDAANKADLVKTLAQAATDLNQGKLFSAATREKTARDHLRDLARVVAPPKEPMALLQEAIDLLGGAINEQQAVVSGVRTIEGEKINDQSVELEERQADLVDGADLIRKDIDEIAPEAAGELRGAEDKMQLTRWALTGTLRRDVAADNAAGAVQRLERARARLMDQLAMLKKEAEKNVIAQAKDLKEQITALRVAEEAVRVDTAPAASLDAIGKRQGELLKTARDLILVVAVEAPAASAPMQDAARDMDAVQVATGAGGNKPEALKSEQSAIDNLLRAEKALQQQIAELERARDDLAKAEKAREDLAKVMEKEQKAEAATAKLAAREELEKAQNRDKEADEKAAQRKADAGDLAQQQDQVGKEADQVKQEVADIQKAASDAMENAQRDIQDAKKNLNQQQIPKAENNARDALADMRKAKDALDEKIADLQEQLGQEQDSAPTLDSIASQLDQAQREVGEAQQQMEAEQPQMQEPAKKMDKVAGDLAKAAAEDKGALPKSAEQAINEAEHALVQAAAAAQHDDPAQAKQQADQAQQSLAQAQAAVAMARNGMRRGEKPENGQQAMKPGPHQPGEPMEKADERNARKGKGDRKDAQVNADSRTGGLGSGGMTTFTGLPAREREAILQDRKEKYPQEYGPMIENYLKGLSDSDR